MVLVVGLSYMAFILLSYVSSVHTLLRGFFFYHKRMLNFVKSFFCIYWDDPVIFILWFVIVVYHIDWFADTEPSLYPQCPICRYWSIKSYLIMVYHLLIVEFILPLFSWGFFHLCLLVILSCNFLLCVCVFVCFWYRGDAGLIEWIHKWSVPSSSVFLE